MTRQELEHIIRAAADVTNQNELNRERLQHEGWVRCEVKIPREDVALIRGVATVLSDPRRKVAARALLRAHFGDSSLPSLKALLAAAPLEGIDIERSADPGRVPDLT